MVDTFLFDLDGTLLPLEMDEFIRIYFSEMGKALSDLIEPKRLAENIWSATRSMVANLEPKTNEAVFMEAFAGLIGGDLSVYRSRFDAFYEGPFLKAKAAVVDQPMIRKSVALLKEKGYELVIATNPIFPKQAILRRIEWAGFSPEDFSYISSYEHNHYCKPQLQFYQEVLADTGKKPEDCMMVGNDVEEDLIAGQLGIETFLITNYLIQKPGTNIVCDCQGDYDAFYRFVTSLPEIGFKGA